MRTSGTASGSGCPVLEAGHETECEFRPESGDSQILMLIVKTTYNSSLGNDFPLVKVIKFALDNEPGVP